MEGTGDGPRKLRIALRDRWLLLLALGTLGMLVAGLMLAGFLVEARIARGVPVAQQTTPGTPLDQVAPGFALRDQMDRPTSLRQFRGKVVVLTFIDPECTQLCPLTTRSLIGALQILGPAAASHVQLLAIDANPQKTGIADVNSYTHVHRLQGRWRFLTGSLPQLESIWKDYHIFVAVEKNDIEHTAVVYLIDGNGHERNVMSTPMSYEAVGDQAQTLAAGIAELLPSRPNIPAPSNPALDHADQPSSAIGTVDLTALGPKRQSVVLGSAHAHLLVFFAGWLDQGPALTEDLSVLDSYATLAQQRGWPSPIAVDVVPTEPSVTEAQQVLTPVAAQLRTPIVEDTTGGLADDYHVDDLPWFVLSSATGDILWRHDGWLSAAEIRQQVGSALAQKPKT